MRTMCSQQKILDATLSLNTTKKKEKLEALEHISNLLNQDDVVQGLCQNVLSDEKKTSWGTIFIRVHNAVVSLIDENCLRTRCLSDKNVQNLINLVNLVIKKSFHDEVLLIDTNLLVSSIIDVFETEFRCKFLGFTYLTIFTKHIIVERRNWSQLKYEYWLGMKNLCRNCAMNPPPGISSISFLEILCEIIKISSKNYLISHHFLDLFDLLKEIWEKYKKVGANNEIIIMRLTNMLCLQMAVEFRYKVCEFTEEVLDCIISLQRRNNATLNTLLHHFLLTTLSVHNPCGVVEDDRAAYAHHLDKWKSHLMKLYCLCQNTIRETLKSSDARISSELLDLFVDVSHLVFLYGIDSTSEQFFDFEMSLGETGPVKKRKISLDGSSQIHSQKSPQIKLDNSFGNLVNNLLVFDALSWFSFVELLVCKYSDDLKSVYHSLVSVLCQFYLEEKDVLLVKACLRCLSYVVEAASTMKLPDGEMEKINNTLNEIHTELLRCLQIEKYKEAHKLIQTLMRHNKISDPGSLLKLYCNGTLTAGLDSFQTLSVLCQNFILPEVLIDDNGRWKQENVRQILLSWLLRGEENYSSKDLGRLLVALTLKKFEDEVEKDGDTENTLIDQSKIDDFCKLITHNYKIAAFKGIKFIENPLLVENKSVVRIDGNVKNHLVRLLKDRWDTLYRCLISCESDLDEQLIALEKGFGFCELVCHLVSHLQTMNAFSADDQILMDKLEGMLHACTTKTLNLLKINSFDLGPLSRIYSTNFHENIQIIIRDPKCFNLNLLQILFDAFVKRHPNSRLVIGSSLETRFNSKVFHLIQNTKSSFNFRNLSNEEKVSVIAAEIMCQYVTGPRSTNKFQLSLAQKMVDALLDEINNGVCSNFQLQLVLRVVHSFAELNGMSVKILDKSLSLLSAILEQKPQEPELNITVLLVLKEFTGPVHKIGNRMTREKYMNMLENFRSIVATMKNCNVKTTLRFIECLTEVFRHDPGGDWAHFGTTGSKLSAFEDVLTFLNHPYHEVRMVAAQQIGFFFVCGPETDKKIIDDQRKMLDNLFSVLHDNALFSTKENDCVSQYSIDTLSSASLISWASIICKSSFWRKRSFFYMFRLACLRKFKERDVNLIVNVIFSELKISSQEKYFRYNLRYLFGKWLENGLPLEAFPYYILGCKSLSDFISTHYYEIVMIYAQFGQIDLVDELPNKSGMTIGKILKSCCPIFISFVLPSLRKNVDPSHKRKSQQLKKLIDNRLTPEVSTNCMSKYLDEIIYNLLRNLYDPTYLLELCNFFVNIEDDQSPWSFTGIEIVETILKISGDRDKPLLEELALECPFVLEKILSLLLENTEMAASYEDKIFAFYKYIFYVEIISKVTKNGRQYQDINAFFIRDVVHTLVGIIRKDVGQALSTMACECLKKLLEAYLTEFGAIVGDFLAVITSALIPLVLKSNRKALDVLHYLLCDNYFKLEAYIALLDPFPVHDLFSRINRQISIKTPNDAQCLETDIKHFLLAGSNKNSGCRVEGLKNLRTNLSSKKDELKKMYEKLAESRGFSEDCKNSLLHQLISNLVELTTNKNPNVGLEAAKCLGELGPSDLTTLVLRPETNLMPSSTSVNNLIKSSLNILSELLTSENYWIKKASSNALYALLSVRQGKAILEESIPHFKSLSYLTPFKVDAKEDLRLQIRKDVIINELSRKEYWQPKDHKAWIVTLVDGLLDSLYDSSGIIDSFKDLIHVNWKFAECLLPMILDLILCFNDVDSTKVIAYNFQMFFESNFSRRSKSKTSADKKSVQCLLNVVDYIRIQRHRDGLYREYGFHSCLNVNYLYLAKAALCCLAFFTSVFYAELWFEEKRGGNESLTEVNAICEMFPDEGFALTQILRECHSNLGNLDGIHGYGYMHVLEPKTEIQHYEHVGNWDLSLLHHDIQLSMGNKDFEIGLMNSMERSGMHYSLNNMVKGSRDSEELTSLQYKCAAQLSDWSLLRPTRQNFTSYSYDKSYYFALKAFHDEDEATFQNEIQRATKYVLNKLMNCSLESSKNLYMPIAQLQTLKELEEFALIFRSSNALDLWTLFNKWRMQDAIKCCDFRLEETILMNRTVFIRAALEKSTKDQLDNDLRRMLCQTYYDAVVAARKEKKYETATRMLNYMRNTEGVPLEISEKAKLERARILWERGDTDIGRFVLSHFIRKNEITGELKAKGLRIYGDWMAKTKGENSREIIHNYYLKAIVQSENASHLVDAYASLAKFADSNYEQLNEYLSSPLFEIKQNLINTQQDLALELRQELGWNQNREKRMAYQIASKQSAIDENEIKNSKAERDSYLCLALKYYLLSMKEGEKYNLFVFRIISLWLSNSTNPEVIQHLKKLLHQIPSYKFLCLLPQLLPRMADVCLISDLVERVLLEHPFHTLPLLFALSNSYEDLKYGSGKTPDATPRVQAAKSVLTKFQKDKKLEVLIGEMERFSTALIELANYSPTEKGSTGHPIEFPDHLKIKKLKNLSTVFVPSINIPYEKNCCYDHVVGIERFDGSYYLVGGINLPKKINCVGSDGISRSLLVKGKDDLRQDAVMQQVFTIMNSLLSQNVETRKRKLVIRTYKVMPLSQRSGIIEWCENTQPLSLYLTGPDGKSGAHKKFYPNDLSAFECRCLVRKVFGQIGATNENKLNTFLDICKRFHPVFRYFFIENFPAAGVWFERRLAYVHSVATSSMIGYILGIGDRHVHNILIDNATAEVIHIDLGIAFEQGKTLPIPETVPFRLTRDVVDGMGLSGVEGDFRISCIKTMEVLRKNQDTILTLLEVLLYDPLYTWTITPEKAYSLQGQAEASSSTTEKSSPDLETNKMAERALIRLKQKLQGTEAGWVATNVEGQIGYLVQQAKDPNNLCRLFHGWQAYL